MKRFFKILFAAAATVLVFASCQGGQGDIFYSEGMRFISASQLKADMQAGTDIFLLDVRSEENFNRASLQGAVPAFAMPIDSDEARQRIYDVLHMAGDRNVVVICNAGVSGVRDTWNFLEFIGYDMSKVFLLAGGQNNWPYDEWVLVK